MVYTVMKTDITVAALGIPSNITVTIITMSNNQCMQKIPSWETNSCSATHSIPCLSQNTSVHYYFHHSLTHTLSLIPLVHPPSVLTHILHCTTSLLRPTCLVHFKSNADTPKWGTNFETLTNHGTPNLTYWSDIGTNNTWWSSNLKPHQPYPELHIY